MRQGVLMSKAALVKWLFIGPPGVGKGTFASRLSQQLAMPHIASGTLLRAAAKKETPIGKAIRRQIGKGSLVASETVVALIMDDIRSCEAYEKQVSTAEQVAGSSTTRKQLPIDAKHVRRFIGDRPFEGASYKVPPKVVPFAHGYILDGFPRSVQQAEFVDALDATDRGLVRIEKVINLRQPPEALLKKVEGRRCCAKCDMVYNFSELTIGGVSLPPLVPKVAGECDRCGDKRPFVARAHDAVDVVQRRLELYREAMAPVEDFYARDGRLVHFDVVGGAAEVVPQLVQLMEREAVGVLTARGKTQLTAP